MLEILGCNVQIASVTWMYVFLLENLSTVIFWTTTFESHISYCTDCQFVKNVRTAALQVCYNFALPAERLTS